MFDCFSQNIQMVDKHHFLPPLLRFVLAKKVVFTIGNCRSWNRLEILRFRGSNTSRRFRSAIKLPVSSLRESLDASSWHERKSVRWATRLQQNGGESHWGYPNIMNFHGSFIGIYIYTMGFTLRYTHIAMENDHLWWTDLWKMVIFPMAP